jgi:hypothetical protein
MCVLSHVVSHCLAKCQHAYPRLGLGISFVRTAYTRGCGVHLYFCIHEVHFRNRWGKNLGYARKPQLRPVIYREFCVTSTLRVCFWA